MSKKLIMKDFTETVQKLIPLIQNHGLSYGLGRPNPGEMCVEAAVCYAMGLEHGDDPKCVGRAVRSFKIRLNDSKWSSNKARGEGMLELAIAQLGSETLDQKEFASKLAIKTVNVLLPTLFEDLEIDHCMKACREAKTLEEAKSAAFASASVSASASASYYAADASYSCTACTACTACAADAAYLVAAESRDGDKYLKLSAKLALEVLKEMKSPGCEYLYLIEQKKPEY